MQVKSLLHGTWLLSLVAALPSPQIPSSFPQNTSHIAQEAICEPKSCGAACKRGVTLGETLRSHLRVTRSMTANYLFSNHIRKRAIDRPAQGKIDAWFQQAWPRLTVEVPVETDTGTTSTAHYMPFLNEPVRMGVKGLYGCTSVIITSKAGAYLSHHWETPFVNEFNSIRDGRGETEVFSQEVVDYLQDVRCLFNKEEDPSTTAVIYTKLADGKIKYEAQVETMKDELASLIPGLEINDIKTIGYTSGQSGSSDPAKAQGKIIVNYDNKAEDGKAAFEVWAGSRTVEGEKLGLPSEKINEPLIKLDWDQLNNQK
ncbi:uncharacterized protein PG998_008161 [Apiospora kogelbergensis]|uniref:uncharacterized protein n=1 Tax=Apiospora kogelbergensis TaxID=1337665 RepID=UPI00312D866C